MEEPYNKLTCQEEQGDYGETFYDIILDGNQIGGAIVTFSYYEDIYDEYNGSVESFDGGCLKQFKPFDKIANIEDFWINDKYQGQGFGTQSLGIVLEKIKQHTNQIILRALPCGKKGGLNKDLLIKLYQKHGFQVLQDTENDGAVMGRITESAQNRKRKTSLKMDKKFLNYIAKLEAYKTAIKNLHWSSKNMSEHKLCDDIADTLASNQDEISEICQGIFEKIEIDKLRPKHYKVSTTQQMLKDLLKDTKTFYSSIKGRQFIGLRSVVEAFIGEINKYQYLVRFVMKEDLIRRVKTHINETKRREKFLTEIQSRKSNKELYEEKFLRNKIQESIMRILK